MTGDNWSPGIVGLKSILVGQDVLPVKVYESEYNHLRDAGVEPERKWFKQEYPYKRRVPLFPGGFIVRSHRPH